MLVTMLVVFSLVPRQHWYTHTTASLIPIVICAGCGGLGMRLTVVGGCVGLGMRLTVVGGCGGLGMRLTVVGGCEGLGMRLTVVWLYNFYSG